MAREGDSDPTFLSSFRICSQNWKIRTNDSFNFFAQDTNFQYSIQKGNRIWKFAKIIMFEKF